MPIRISRPRTTSRPHYARTATCVIVATVVLSILIAVSISVLRARKTRREYAAKQPAQMTQTRARAKAERLAEAKATQQASSNPVISYERMADYTWEALDARLKHVSNRDLTSVQREALTSQYVGAWVRMTGTITDVKADGSIRLKCNPDTLTSDTVVHIRPEEWPLLMDYSRGSQITLTAQFKGHNIFGHDYVNGDIFGR